MLNIKVKFKCVCVYAGQLVYVSYMSVYTVCIHIYCMHLEKCLYVCTCVYGADKYVYVCRVTFLCTVDVVTIKATVSDIVWVGWFVAIVHAIF